MADYNADQRVTNAVILHKLESMDKEWHSRFDDLDRRMNATENKLDQVRIAAAPCVKRFEGIEGKVDGLEKKINGWSSINSAGALFAMILGIFSK